MYSVSIIVVLLLCFYDFGLISKTNQCSSSTYKKRNPTNLERSKKANYEQYSNELKCSQEPASCSNSKYRTITGVCNNLNYPTWGTPQMPYGRFLGYKYGDGVSTFPKTCKGNELPNARDIRLVIFPDKNIDDKKFTLLTMQFGQLIAHDMSRTAGSTQISGKPLICCNTKGDYTEDAKTNPLCAPIKVSNHDPVYASQGKKCIDFVRTLSTKDNNCMRPNTPAQPLNAVTAYLDLSFVYGSSVIEAKLVRAGYGGRLKTEKRHHQEWPPHHPLATDVCDGLKKPSSPCYLAGDMRANQNPQLTLLQTVFLRQHNYMADKLYKMNPHWGDKKTYEETRRLFIAIFQYIIYYKYLPIILGRDYMIANKLIYPDAKDYINDYNSSINPSVYAEHATSGFRRFHSSVQGHLYAYKEDRELKGSLRLSNSFNNPAVLEKDDNFDSLARGLCHQPENYNDEHFTEELTEYFQRGDNKYGDDLIAIDIQRGRDQGLVSYVHARAGCHLSVPKTFDDMREYISQENIKKLKDKYECLEDVDLIVGGSLEILAPNAQVGETFRCIIAKQFEKTRVGDRYFFESYSDHKIAFTLSQLNSIRSGSCLSRILCDNVDSIKSIQPNPFEKVSDKNYLTSCENLPYVDLTPWKEDKPKKKGKDKDYTSEKEDKSHEKDKNSDYTSKKEDEPEKKDKPLIELNLKLGKK